MTSPFRSEKSAWSADEIRFVIPRSRGTSIDLSTHLPDQHDQSSHGRKGIRKPDTDVTPRTRARRQSAERERRDIEAQARREAQEAVDMHAARAMAELAIEFEELAAKGASPRAMTHRVRARMRRLGLEPSVEQAGQQVTFDPDRHEVIGARPAAGEQVLVVRPGYVWARPGGEALIERPTVIGAAPSSVTSLLTHLPGLHDQKDHGRRYGPGDVRPSSRSKTKPATGTPKRSRAPRTPPQPPPLTPQQEAMRAIREPPMLPTAADIRRIYGARLRDDGSQLANAAVEGLARIPESIHQVVKNHMDSWFPAAGIYLTEQQMVDFVPEIRPLATQQPRGYPQGSTWRDSTGVYSSAERLIAVGTNQSGGGRSDAHHIDTAQHEMGHALDDALGRPSATSMAWDAHIRALNSSPQLNVNPYYRPDGNPDGWRSEAFAQALRGWADGLRSRRQGNRVYVMLDAFGHFQRDYTKWPYEQDFEPALAEAAQYMISFFDRAAGV